MKVNRYPGACTLCGARVAAKAGRLTKVGRRWTVAHLDCADAGEPRVMAIEIGGHHFTRNSRGRCEDAPCCGCCTI